MTQQQPTQNKLPSVSSIALFWVVMSCLALLLLPIPPIFIDFLVALNFTLALVLLCIALYAQRLAAVASFAPILGLSIFFRFALSVTIYRYFFAYGFLMKDRWHTANDLLIAPNPQSLDFFINFTGGGNILWAVISGPFICLFPVFALLLVFIAASYLKPKTELEFQALSNGDSTELPATEKAPPVAGQLLQTLAVFQSLRGVSFLLGIEAFLGLLVAFCFASSSITLDERSANIQLFDFPIHGNILVLNPKLLHFCLIIGNEALVRGIPLTLLSVALWLLLSRQDSKPRSLGEQFTANLLQHPYSLCIAAFMLMLMVLSSFLFPGAHIWFILLPIASCLMLMATSSSLVDDVHQQLKQYDQAIAQHKARLGILESIASPSPLTLEVSEAVSKQYQLHYINSLPIDTIRNYPEPCPQPERSFRYYNEKLKYTERKMKYEHQALKFLLAELNRESSLLCQLQTLYHSLRQDYGYVIEPIQIQINNSLTAGVYRLTLLGKPIAQGSFDTDDDPVQQHQSIQSFLAQLKTTLLDNAAHLLSYHQVSNAIEQVKQLNEPLVNALVPTPFSILDIKHVFAVLLQARVSIRNVVYIIERMADLSVENPNIKAISQKLIDELRSTE